MCIHCSLRKQKCRLKSTTTNGWRHFGQSEQRKSSVLFPIQSEKSPDSGFFACDLWKKCIMPSSRKQITEIKGKGMIAGYFHGNGPSRVFLFWSKAGKFKIYNQNNEKMWILLFFIAKLPEKVKKIAEFLLRFQRWMKKTNIPRARSVLSWTSGNFWWRSWNRHRRKPAGQRRFYQPTEKCKLLNTNKTPLHWS